MPSYSELSLSQKIQYAKDVSMNNNGVVQPSTTELNTGKLDKLINDIGVDISSIKQLLGSLQLTSGASPYTFPVPYSTLPGEVQTKLNQFIPPGYSPPTTITGQELIDIEQGVLDSLQTLRSNPATLPRAGSGVVPAVSASPATSTVKTVTTPQTTSSPSNSGVTTTDIIKAAVIVEGGIALFGALANASTNIQNTSPNPVANDDNPNPVPSQQSEVTTPPVTTPETTTGYQADPTIQTFDDGSSIQTFDDGSTLVTDAEGKVTSTAADPGATGSSRGLGGQTNETRSTATAQDTANFETKQDWRVRLSLAPSATYLYKAENPGILKPLKDTDGVIFPYLPTVNVSYIANYDPQELTHSNYKAYQYRSSSVEQVQISGDFTAQDTNEANYMLAVIHFFRSVTKMFYGQDQNPKPGTPPPLVFLFGLGDFQFNAHPLVVTNFNYSLPNDVDYIRASAPTLGAGVSTAGYTTASNSTSPTNTRLNSSGLNTGATAASPQFQTDSNSQPTYVPTKMQIQITALPMVTRNDISNNFSLKQYATGALLRGSQNKRAGIW